MCVKMKMKIPSVRTRITNLKIAVVTIFELLSVCHVITALPTLHDAQRGPTFFNEPPGKVEFQNDTGTVVTCSAQGHPPPMITWTQQDGSPLRDVVGIRHARPDGTLVFPPFAAEDFRQGVHDAAYRCVASNVVGSVISREVHVKAVVQRRYKVQVYDEFVVRGNTAVLKCQVPTFVRDYVTFVWKRGDGALISSTVNRGGRYSILPTGELYIRAVTQSDGQKGYSCQTRHRLTGDVVTSASAGSLVVRESHGTSAPKITDYRAMVSANEGETLEMACAASAHPPPTYRWYREEDGHLAPLTSNHRISQLEGSLIMQFISVQDSGRYICISNNTAGEDRAFTLLTVTAPLTVYVSPQRQVAEMGRPATFNCSVSGYPIRSLNWMKDQRPIEDFYGGGRAMLLARDVLHIPSVQREDKGMYQCFAFNDFESAQSTAELKLGDVAPVLLATFIGEAVRPGTTVSLRCSASGNPLPQVTWYLDEVSIPDAIRFRVGDYVTSEGHVMSYVNISDVRVEDGGEYSCSAANTLASVRHAARLDVYGPPFVRLMPNMSAVAGETVVLRCPIFGYPIESVRWVKDGATLPINHRQKVLGLEKLQIHEVQRTADEGHYTCQAEAANSKIAEGKMYMQVQVAPFIDPQTLPENLFSREGSKTKIMCSVSQGDPPIQVSWRKNGLPLPLDKDLTLQNLEDSSILIFKKTASRHTGNYTCIASNSAAVVNRTTSLIVNVPPKWVVEPSNSFAIVGQSVTMDCVAEGHPSPRIYWKKSSGAQATDFRDILSSYRRQVFDNGSLALQEVEESDGGHYLCQAANGIGAGLSKVVHLTIHTPPKFDTKFISHTVPKGKAAELKCEAIGELPIRIKWEKDKQPLDPQTLKRLTVAEETGTQSAVSKLIIADAGRVDSALYTCLASNQFGADETNMQLVVQEPPAPPVDLIVKEKSSRTITLGWSPTFSGNSPITKFMIHYGNASSSAMVSENLKEAVFPGSDLTATIRGLLPSSSYQFRVIASNVLGRSEPSDFITATTDEEVPGGPPLDVEVRPTGSQSLKVTWKSPRKDLQHGTIHGYYIGYKVSDSDEQYQYKNVEATDGQELSYLTNLRRLTRYKVIVQAYNNIGAGPRSDEVTATTLEAAPPTSPHLTLSTVTSSTLTVRWDRQQDDTGIREYIVHYKTEGGSDIWKEQKLSTSGSHYTLEGLRCGTGYRLYMTASNSLGIGEPSDIISARTKGAAPVSPQKDAFLNVNSTFVTLHFGAWSNGGCPILHYSVHFRFQEQWKVVADRVDASQPQMDVRHLTPGKEYTLRVSAHSEAGTTEAEYRFYTLNITVTPPLLKSYPPSLNQDGLPLPFYKNLTVLLPVVISVVVLLIVVITVIVCLRKQVDTGSMSEDSRKGRSNENMGLNEFPQKNTKEHDGYRAKSSYYSSPARKPLALASSSQRDPVENSHEYAEPYCTVPAPRCLMDDLCAEEEAVLASRVASEGPYATVKRSPPRSGEHFLAMGPVVDLRFIRPMSCVERQDQCNNSSSSQSGTSCNDSYRQYRQGISVESE